jgi:ribose 5-phosphate isomerase B
VRVVIGSDHGGYSVKGDLVKLLTELGHEVADFGTHSIEPVDYPDIACLVATTVARDLNSVGIIIDGAGTGSAIAANKVPGIRAAACYDTFTAKNSREHNNANVLTLGSRNTGIEVLKDIVKVWLSTSFAGSRHNRRFEKMLQVERRFMKDL